MQIGKLGDKFQKPIAADNKTNAVAAKINAETTVNAKMAKGFSF